MIWLEFSVCENRELFKKEKFLFYYNLNMFII